MNAIRRKPWRPFLTLLGLTTLGSPLFAAAADRIVLFPGGAPGARGEADTDVPTLTVVRASPANATGAAIVFLPGGGYSQLTYNAERQALVAWLAERGATVFVLRYRHGGNGYLYPAPFQDATRALRWVRTHASSYGIDPVRIGIMGASAGGHLAALVSTRFDDGEPQATDPVERASSRPDFSVLFYPVVTLSDPELTHAGSRRHLVGTGADAEERAAELSVESRITAQTPPTFLVFGGEDATVHPANGALYALALQRAGVKIEAHLFETGPHAFGLPTKDPALAAWQGLLDTWMVRHRVFR
jgi:acetyl esterase/lipase